MGVSQAQIGAAAGHQEPGSGRNYTHLRPEYLVEFVAAIEAYWREIDRYTSAHRHPNWTAGGQGARSQIGPKPEMPTRATG